MLDAPLLSFATPDGRTVHVCPTYASQALSALARAQRWTDYFALLAQVQLVQLPEAFDARRRQLIPIVRMPVDVTGEG